MAEKIFNVTGPCIPELHYMVDTSKKIKTIIREYIEKGCYFTINRARQYGKTTTIGLLARELKKDHIVLPISFEGFGADVFSDEREFVQTFMRRCYQRVPVARKGERFAELLSDSQKVSNIAALGDRIVEITETAPMPMVLVIDEVDKSSNEQLFLDFLGMLREKYNDRLLYNASTFSSVILVGVHDVKNLKLKLRSQDQTMLNSPWNIAATFDMDMSFSSAEIATMLEEYEADHHSGMDISGVAERIYYYTSGYPFLVSYICKVIYDNELSWNIAGIDEAKKKIIKTGNTLFDDVIKNITNNVKFDDLLRRILYVGEEVAYQFNNPEIELGTMYGILKEEDHMTVVANIIFKNIITDYYISIDPNKERIALFEENRYKFIKGDGLDMPLIMSRFAEFMKEEYREEDSSFIEREGRLLFLGFLKPVINGTGHYDIESEIRGNRRMDVVVHYGIHRYIIELKIWHGESKAREAIVQLKEYLAIKQEKEGYLLSFCDNIKAPRKAQIYELDGYRIYETVIAYRDKE